MASQPMPILYLTWLKSLSFIRWSYFIAKHIQNYKQLNDVSSFVLHN